ncbi:ABC transporter substrate-binding protein [Streptomyces sp. PSKA54]|uniref:ABC transporter substrate-binding protein n=1 Tax=Streptomyces himalayensis subsp. aureolus TaxID=2758039 RepID=A0A7W2D4K0_9ACTN|nr:ABC transporter substrate-binding protein [Streptomyces himalayensis subsp. aureolus]
MPPSPKRLAVTGVSSAFVLLSATACGAGAATGSTEDLKAAPAAQRLDGVCPDKVVVQIDWEPEAEHGPLYNLVGPGYTVDTDKKRVTGPLVIDGKDTGVQIELRAGGSAIGYQSVTSQMYLDKDITLATVTTDAAIESAAKRPVTAVAALMKKSPQILMWDPKTHPDWRTVADIGKSDAKVVYRDGNVFVPMLVDKGLIKKSQLDASYDGSPSRFVANPDIVQQGFATAEPYIYEHEVSAWKKPVKYQLLADVGYNVYPQALSVRSGAVDELAPCLKKLVPIVQRSAADFAAEPDAAIGVIDDLVTQYNTSWVYSKGTGEYAAQQMVKLGILANESDGSVGSFDMDRVGKILDTVAPLLTKDGVKVPADLTADDLATTRFIDTSIGLK